MFTKFALLLLIGATQVMGDRTLPSVGKNYLIQLRYPSTLGLCLSVDGGSMDNNAPMNRESCIGYDKQIWKLVKPTKCAASGVDICGSYYNLVNKGSGKCLTAGKDMSGADNNTPVLQYECQDPPSYSQLWYVDPNTSTGSDSEGNAYFRIAGNGWKCLSFHGSGESYFLYDCSYSYQNQYFTFLYKY